MYSYEMILDYFKKDLFTLEDLKLLIEVGSIPANYFERIKKDIKNKVI